MQNPYSLIFGKDPGSVITRAFQTNTVIDTFTSEDPATQLFLITGVRGVGKTVFMTHIQSQLSARPDWICIEVNPEKEVLSTVVSKLSSENKFATLFKNAKINLSFWGLGLEVSGVAPITDIEVAASKVLSTLQKHNKRVLITIDEVTNNSYMREFAASYQILVRQNLPLYLLMTGLYDNINNLQNAKSLTFLYRAPRLSLTPLNITAIAANYEKNFKLPHDKAMEMAYMTRGYSFAFQLLGYLSWERDLPYTEILPEYRQYLDEYVYDKIWSELSPKDKTILNGISRISSGKIETIREALGLTTNEFNPYRKRLINKGLIDGSDRGYVRFTLPLFEEYVKDNY